MKICTADDAIRVTAMNLKYPIALAAFGVVIGCKDKPIQACIQNAKTHENIECENFETFEEAVEWHQPKPEDEPTQVEISGMWKK